MACLKKDLHEYLFKVIVHKHYMDLIHFFNFLVFYDLI